jgi:integrase/ferredoxin
MDSRNRQAPPQPAAGRARLLEKLMAAVRPEFRASIYLPGPGDPVLGAGPCTVPGCDLPGKEHGLCSAHMLRWYRRGRPGMGEFLADPGPALRGHRPPRACLIGGCRYGTYSRGLCARHRRQWDQAGQPGLAAWAPAVTPPASGPPGDCGLPWCSLWPESDDGVFCRAHTARWRRSGIGDPAEFITASQRAGRRRIDYRQLPPQLTLEFQYAVQCRSGERTHPAPPWIIQPAIRLARHAGVTSLLDHPEQQWRDIAAASGLVSSSGQALGFLFYACNAVDLLQDGPGWEAEYPRDIWRASRLPGITTASAANPGQRRLRFDRIGQPWLKDLAKQWIRLRLTSGLALSTAEGDLIRLTRFSSFLTQSAASAGLPDVDRELVERYLAWLPGTHGAGQSRGRIIGTLATFLQAVRRHGWDDGLLPAGAMIFPEDYPRPGRQRRLPRALAEHVMAQVENPASLGRWPHPEGRLLTLILIRCGLRITSACALPFDCLIRDGQGAPYLRYVNTKMNREAAVPVDDELETAIGTQQQRVLRRWPDGSPHLFPKLHANISGQRCWPAGTYRDQLYRWLDACDIRDEHGQPVHLTPHQWRHTFGTRLVNRDVPLEVIRILLDHESTEMTAYYAKISDETVRRHWENGTRVNINGERVTIGPDGPLAQAQWAKTRYGMATQTLPNGWCGLPIQKRCPHANACLTCPVFLTGPEFLPELREQRRRTLTLIDVSQNNGQARLAEMNAQVLANLDRMIGEIDKDTSAGAADAS